MKSGLILLLPAMASAHMVSMSTGDLKVDGNRAEYQLRMPVYEAAHAPDPARTLLQHIRFRSGGADARVLRQQCGPQADTYVCDASYEFPSAADSLEIECSFASVTVANHIHVLRASRGDKSDQAVFDASFPSAEIRFRPPPAWEVFLRQSGAGFTRAVGGLAPLLFLISLALAARNAREMALLAACFITGEAGACALFPRFGLALSPRFIEAAAALTIAYLAFEIVLLPNSGQRGLVVGILGLFHGAYFSSFLTSSGYSLINFLTGVIAAELLALAVLFFLLARVLRLARFPRAVPALAALLLTTGAVWFAIRVWS